MTNFGTIYFESADQPSTEKQHLILQSCKNRHKSESNLYRVEVDKNVYNDEMEQSTYTYSISQNTVGFAFKDIYTPFFLEGAAESIT